MLGNWAGSLRSCLLLCWGCHPVMGKQPVWRGMEQLCLCCTGSETFETYLPSHFHGLSQLPWPLPHPSWESLRYVSYLLPLNLLAVSAEGCPIAPVAIWDSLLTIGNRHPASKSPGRKTSFKPQLLALLWLCDTVQLVLLALHILWSRTGIQVSHLPVKGSNHQAR